MTNDFRPYRGFAEIRLLREEDLFHNSYTGWELLAAKEERRAMQQYDNIGNSLPSVVEQHVVLVMGRPHQSAVLTLKQQNLDLESLNHELAKQELESKKERDELKKANEALKEALDKANSTVSLQVEKALSNQHAENAQLKEKIGELAEMVEFANTVTERLRQWCGEKMWNEVTWLVEEDRNQLRQNAARAGNMAKEEGLPNL